MANSAVGKSKHYIIRGGVEGRERLRLLARVMQPTTHALLQRSGIRLGMRLSVVCLECGWSVFDRARVWGARGRGWRTQTCKATRGTARGPASSERLSRLACL